jgi:regulatory protein
MGKITKIEQQKKKKSRVNIYIDGEFTLGLYKDTVVKFHLYENKEITSAEISSIKEFEELTDAKEKVLNFISYRERSRKEIEDYLSNKEFRQEVTDKVLEDMEKSGLVDDRRFTIAWIKNRNKINPKGNFALKIELQEKGIEEDEIEKILADVDEKENARKVIKKAVGKYGRSKSAKRKIMEYLRRRGFSINTSIEVLNELYSEEYIL